MIMKASSHRRGRMAASLVMGLVSCVVLLARQDPDTFARAASGSLYVVTSDYMSQTGRLLVVDPSKGRVAGGLTKGYYLDVLPSPDNTRLYVSYNNRVTANNRLTMAPAAFEVLDAASGTVLVHVDEADRRTGHGDTYRTRMSLSRDGSWLYRYKTSYSAENGPSYWIETFDTVRQKMLPGKVVLSLCGFNGTVYPTEQREVLQVVCPDSEDVRVVTLASTGAPVDPKLPRMNLGPGTKEGFVPPAFLGDGGQTLTVIATDGSFVKLATDTHSIVRKDSVDRAARRVAMPDDKPQLARRTDGPPSPTDWLAQRIITGPGAVLSADRSKVYVMAAARSGAIASEFVTLDAATLDRVGGIPYTRPYVSFTVSADGKRLYAVDYDHALLAVIDPASGQEIGQINAGGHPVFAVVAP